MGQFLGTLGWQPIQDFYAQAVTLDQTVVVHELAEEGGRHDLHGADAEMRIVDGQHLQAEGLAGAGLKEQATARMEQGAVESFDLVGHGPERQMDVRKLLLYLFGRPHLLQYITELDAPRSCV